MYTYKVSLEKAENEKGILSIPQKPPLEVSTPPEFKGVPGVWTPEDLLVASVESCLMTTLFYFLRRKKIPPSAYESKAVGILDKTPKGLRFTSMTIDATLELPENHGDETMGEELANLTEKHCLVSQSVSCPITYNLRIVYS